MSEILGSGLNYSWNEIDTQFKNLIDQNLPHKERANLMRLQECPLWLLKGCLEYDTHFIVLEAAATNPKCRPEWHQQLKNRFGWPENFWPILHSQAQAELDHLNKKIENDFDLPTLEDLEQTAKNADPKIRINTKKILWDPTTKRRIAMICAPSWAVAMPPYNLAKLTAVLRTSNYDVRVYDPNVDCFRYILEQYKEELWQNDRFQDWCSKPLFKQNIFPKIKTHLDLVIKDIIDNHIDVVGFTTYDTNLLAIIYMAATLRKLQPNICMMVGGPLATDMKGHWFRDNYAGLFNYIFIGEAEDSLVHTLDNLPEQLPLEQDVGTIFSRLDLSQYPYTDYDDYDLKLYTSRGISLELSRGCIAKCSFCAETTRWKYRSVAATRTVEEIQYQVQKYGVENVWFVDSLINGNLKEFQELIDMMIENKVQITWVGQARCNGKMTEEFFRKIKLSGCKTIYFGVESASQRVLDDMIKKVHVWEIEQNLRDCRRADLYTTIFWMTGFVTESNIDVLHGLQFLYNQRTNVNMVLSGTGFGPTPLSDTDTNWRAYKFAWKNRVGDNKFLGEWYTENYRNTVIHRFLRVKLTNVWLNIIKTQCKDAIMVSGNKYFSDNVVYSLSVKGQRNRRIETSDFVNLTYHGASSLSEQLSNEYLTFAYALYTIFGEFEWSIECSPEQDHPLFGDLLTRQYRSSVKIVCNQAGDYSANIQHSLDHSAEVELDYEREINYVEERLREDMSFEDHRQLKGNFNNWITDQIQTEPSVHVQFSRTSWMMKQLKGEKVKEGILA